MTCTKIRFDQTTYFCIQPPINFDSSINTPDWRELVDKFLICIKLKMAKVWIFVASIPSLIRLTKIRLKSAFSFGGRGCDGGILSKLRFDSLTLLPFKTKWQNSPDLKQFLANFWCSLK